MIKKLYTFTIIYKYVKYLFAFATLCTASTVTSTVAFSCLFVSSQDDYSQCGYTDHSHSYNNICKIHRNLL